ncbi:hypothetical protein [Myroides phaeus]|uniref:hypothetical protein n=1 Tax=Myroides phaeus TaxID=702745 RepID=UPI001303BC41|nr:hypothetical protein [Myroides phaeus]
MKKLVYLFACTALFAACSSDDSNVESEVVPPVVIEPTKSKVVFSTYDNTNRISYLYELNPVDGQYEKIKEFKESEIDNLQNFSYDATNKIFYGISSEQKLLKFDLEKKETISIKTITPDFGVDIDYSFIDKRGKMFAYGYNKMNPLLFNNFISIDKEMATGIKGNSSKELSKMLVGNSIFYYTYNEQQDKVVALFESFNREADTSDFSLLLLNPTNLEEFDTQKEKNTIVIKQLDHLADTFGIVVDKNQNYYIGYEVYDEDEVAFIDTTTGELHKLFNLYSIYGMTYDKNSNSLYVFSKEKNDKVYFTAYNIDTKEKRSIELKGNDFEVFGLTVINE